MHSALGRNPNSYIPIKMKIASLILGLIGSLLLLAIGTFGFALGGLVGSGGLKALSAILPVVALIGSCMALSKPVAAGVLMAGSTLTFVGVVGFNFATMIPAVLLGVAALMAFAGAGEAKTPVQ